MCSVEVRERAWESKEIVVCMAATDWEHRKETGLKGILSAADALQCVTPSGSPGILAVVKDLCALTSGYLKAEIKAS